MIQDNATVGGKVKDGLEKAASKQSQAKKGVDLMKITQMLTKRHQDKDGRQ